MNFKIRKINSKFFITSALSRADVCGNILDFLVYVGRSSRGRQVGIGGEDKGEGGEHIDREERRTT